MNDVTVNMAPPEVIVRDMLILNRAIDDFLADCRRRRMSERTITTYARTLDEFALRRDVEDLDVSKITRLHIERYLATKSRLARGTVSGVETHLNMLFKYLLSRDKIARNPIDGMIRTRRTGSDDLDVLSVDADDLRRMLQVARPGSERNAIAVLAFLGPRRHAISRLRLRDYNRKTGEMRFYEKGDKVIWKPVPHELRSILDASIAAGDIWPAPNDYLVPPEGFLQRPGDRDDRVIWRLVKVVAARAGVDAHVHALRAAFAVYYLENFERDTLGLQELMGHVDPKTTRTYLRKYDKKRAMEPVRDLSWGVAITDNAATSGIPQTAGKTFDTSSAMGAGGFEPPFPEPPAKTQERSEHPGVARTKAAREAAVLRRELEGRAREPEDAEATRERER